VSTVREPAPVQRLAWATDIHLNFLSPSGLSAFCDTLAKTPAGAFLVTGDIAEAPSVERSLGAMAAAVERPFYFVLGNHDSYRGSITAVRARMRELCAQSPWLRWLPAAPIVELTPTTALVGHDGWADGRLGDYLQSPVLLNDYALIKELAYLGKRARLTVLKRLGDEAAAYLRPVLSQALKRYPRVVVATHVPPFKEACWHEGRISNDDWLPHFTCKAVGDVLRKLASARPDRRIDVLCGHTHGAGVAQILPNLTVRTGHAEYGEPEVQDVIQID
jgi:3',5'-cyclic AMP phosphodiesterase CpdA